MKIAPQATYLKTVPVLSPVSAGFLAPCDMWKICGYRKVRLLKQCSNNNLAVSQVEGDCLSKIGIYDGDWILFRFACEAMPGECVIAATPYGVTAKYFFPKPDGTVELCTDKDGNNVSSVWMQEDVRIQGVVIHLVEM